MNKRAREGFPVKRRTCAGKPDGTPCQAPAVTGGAYCRHHRPQAPQAFYRRGRFLYHQVRFTSGLRGGGWTLPLVPEEIESTVRGNLTDRGILELIRASVAHAMGLPEERQNEVEVPAAIVDSVREQFVQAHCEVFLSEPEASLSEAGVPIRLEIRWPAAVPSAPLPATEHPHPVRTDPVADAPNNKGDDESERAVNCTRAVDVMHSGGRCNALGR